MTDLKPLHNPIVVFDPEAVQRALAELAGLTACFAGDDGQAVEHIRQAEAERDRDAGYVLRAGEEAG